MLTSLLVAAAVAAPAAPVPKDAAPNPTGPAPRVVAAKAEPGGGVWVTAHVYQKVKVQQNFFAVENGKQVMKQQEVEQVTSQYVRKSIADFGGKFATADGTVLTADAATQRVRDGATLLVTADGKPVDAGWLRAVQGDTVVMTADGLGEAHFLCGHDPYPATASPRLVLLAADDKGEVRVPVNPNPNVNGLYNGGFGGKAQFRGNARIMIEGDVMIGGAPAAADPGTPAGADGKKQLADLKFDAYDVNGKLVNKGEALERLRAGGLVLVAGDYRFPDANYLKAFRDDVLVIVSPELVFQPGQPNPFDRATAAPAKPAKPAGQPGLVPAVAPATQLAPAIAAPAVIKRVQVQIDR
ncbi:hypothetical protein [Gemmata sp.]|uniref:hypothetical protein n=1 Tax=Gemmata sp. TaxID=1914242 RepID=UPI003F71A8C6